MGERAQNIIGRDFSVKMLTEAPRHAADPKITDVLQKYGAGGMSLQEALAAMRADPKRKGDIQGRIAELKRFIEPRMAEIDFAGKHGHGVPIPKDLQAQRDELLSLEREEALGRHSEYDPAMMEQLFSSPLTAGRAAAEQIQTNPLFAGMFGEGGIQSQRQAQEKELGSRGYSLQPEDYEAYGQAAGQIARQYGGYEGALTQALAARGLEGGGGAPTAAFSGLMGNKLEQLAGQQRQIAQQRMAMNLQRLAEVRGAVDAAQQQGLATYGTQLTANQQGIENRRNQLKDAVAAISAVQGQENTGFDQNEATSGHVAIGTFGKAIVDMLAAGSGLTTAQATQLLELYKLRGLQPGRPMTVTPSLITVDDIELEITGDGETSTTVTRK